LGIGARQSARYVHYEEPRNTDLAPFLNAGWLGGAMWLAPCHHALTRSAPCRVLPATAANFSCRLAAVAGHAVEAAVIDIDHWRHF